MNKTILSILLIALVGTISAQEEEAKFQFNIDFEVCFTNAAKLSHDIKIALAAIQADPINVATTLTNLYTAIEDVNPLLHGCSLDIKLVDKFDSFTFNNTNTCFSNIDTAVNATKTVVSLIKEKEIVQDLIPIVQKLQILLKTLPTIKESCSVVAKTQTTPILAEGFELNLNLIKCFTEAKKDFEAGQKLVQDYKNNTLPVEDIFEETINFYNNSLVTIRDCGINVITLPAIENVSGLKTCVKNGHNIFNNSKKIVEDLKTFNVKDIFPALKAIYADAVELKEVCVVKRPAFLSN